MVKIVQKSKDISYNRITCLEYVGSLVGGFSSLGS